ncbi:hypothetical protein ACFWHR_03980 [Leucobacter sp. NPDC058333]|uniref:hypothetical protein n=1 Tax=Leucobacter sp. NPDC058333 TaxID=3346450 RepID=UPI003652BC2E
MSRRTRSLVARSTFILIWLTIWFIAGYFTGVEGVESGLASGLVVLGINATILVLVAGLCYLIHWVTDWVEMGGSDAD